MVPPELIPDRTPDTYDSVKVNTSVTLGDMTLPSDAVKYASQLYAGMTRDEVHQLLGEPSFSMSTPFNDSYELDPDAHERQLGIYYDVDGTIIQVKYFPDGTDPDVPGIDLTPFLTAAGEDGGIVGEEFYAYEFVSGSDNAVGGKAAPVPSAEPAPVVQPLGSTAPFIACGEEGCTIPGEHFHENGKAVPVSHYEAPLVEVCPVAGCDEITSHQHNGRWYCLMHYVCPMENCTLMGEHIHDGVPYSCNGAHSGGVCDGNHHTNSTQSGTTHHSESHSSGHHGSSHH